MSKHTMVALALLLAASGAWITPSTAAARSSSATEAELLSVPGSAGYPVPGDGDQAEDDGEVRDGEGAADLLPLCEGEGDEGDDRPDHGDEPGDGGGDGDEHPEGDVAADESDDEPGC